MREKLTGLYAITDAKQDDPQKLISDVGQALLGGARIIQFRDKSNDAQQRLKTASQLRELTQQHNALFIINDDVQLAEDCHADGVHLGRDDSEIADARKQLGAAAIIGVSCYNDFSLAKQAANNGANYIAFGRFFPSRTKPHAVIANLELLQKAQQELTIPIVAIGGINQENAHALIDNGANMLAVVDGLFNQLNIKQSALHFQQLFKR